MPGPEGKDMVARVASSLFSVGTFVAAYALAWRPDGFLGGFLLAGTLVSHVLANAALQSMHRKDGRPWPETAAAALFPAGVFAAACAPWGGTAREFWVFTGLFHFLAVTGGFLLGVFTSPLLAVREGLDPAVARGGVRFGLGHLRAAVGLRHFGVVLLAATVAGGAVLAGRGVEAAGIARLPAGSRLAIAIALAASVATVLRFTFRHTVFGLLAARPEPRP